MSMDMQHFSNGEFDIDLIPDGDTFKVTAPGLARSLGFDAAKDMLRSIPEPEKGWETAPTPGGEQRIGVVTESGFYRAIGQRQAARIKDPEIRALVERFQSWVYGDVLPSIRRHGGYLTEQKVEEVLSDPDTIIRLATDLKAERARAALAEKKSDALARHKKAIEGGDGINPTDFGKKYFSDVPAKKFQDHLYDHGWQIKQIGTREMQDGTFKNGYDHGKPTAKGRPYFYNHDGGNHGGKRRFSPRIRPQMEIELRDRLAAEGLPVNEHSTGLVLFSDDEVRELGA